MINQVIDFISAVIILISIYFIPGLILSNLFTGRLRTNVFFILFLSLVSLPFVYLGLAAVGFLNIYGFLILEGGLFALSFYFSKKRPNDLINSEDVFPLQKIKDPASFRVLDWGVKILMVTFLILVMAGKIGLPQGYLPVGDDKARLQKVTAVALSDKTPLFYNFPLSEMTIYYFNNIPSGLLTKFTDNYIMVHQSWFIHNFVITIVMLWLIWLLATRLFHSYLERFVLVFSLTFSSGLEFFLGLFKGVRENHLEWWTDWIGLNPQIHTQISAFFTLFYWVSQHLFGGLLVIPLYFLITSDERRKITVKIMIALILASMLGYSMFTFLPTVFIYGLYYLIRLWQKKESFSTLFTENVFIIIVAVLLSIPMIGMYLGAEKGHYFSFHTNVFWFLPNDVLVYKPLNIFLTAFLFFVVEFGILFLAFCYGFWLFIRKKLYQTKMLFWGLFLFIPLWVIFLMKALDDNNISMRSMIPSQVALAVFAAWIAGYLQVKLKRKTGVLNGLLVIMIVLSLPTVLWEAYHRYESSFHTVDPIYSQIDEKLPLNSIILSSAKDEPQDLISVAGHRFTFKEMGQFNIADYEYVALSKLAPYTYSEPTDENWNKIITGNTGILKEYEIYYLGENSPEHDDSQDLFRSEKFFVSRVSPFLTSKE